MSTLAPHTSAQDEPQRSSLWLSSLPLRPDSRDPGYGSPQARCLRDERRGVYAVRRIRLSPSGCAEVVGAERTRGIGRGAPAVRGLPSGPKSGGSVRCPAADSTRGDREQNARLAYNLACCESSRAGRLTRSTTLRRAMKCSEPFRPYAKEIRTSIRSRCTRVQAAARALGIDTRVGARRPGRLYAAHNHLSSRKPGPPYTAMRMATSYLATAERWPGVSPAGMAPRISSPRW